MTETDIKTLLKRGLPSREKEVFTLVETHISWVLLGATHVYKIKKPLKFSFLDFSSLEKRRFYCGRELVLNQRLTHGVYLAVLPVVRQENKIFISPDEPADGVVIDYALKMKRLDSSRQMDHLLQQGQLAAAELDPLAETIARFHRQADRSPTAPDPAAIQEDFADIINIKGYLQSQTKANSDVFFDRTLAFSSRFLRQHQHRLQARWEAGLVIDGHGDFHSRNIFLLNPPVIFDCIEFNDHYRYIDVLDEIAFFCMDLDFFERPDLHDHFLRQYLHHYSAMPLAEDRQLFLYFKWYRANIRLKVDALAAQHQETEGLRRRTTRYFDLFQNYYRLLQGL